MTPDMPAGLSEAAVVHVHVVRDDQVPVLAALAATATDTELADPRERADRPGDETGTRYLILWGDQDGRRAWLRAGQRCPGCC